MTEIELCECHINQRKENVNFYQIFWLETPFSPIRSIDMHPLWVEVHPQPSSTRYDTSLLLSPHIHTNAAQHERQKRGHFVQVSLRDYNNCVSTRLYPSPSLPFHASIRAYPMPSLFAALPYLGWIKHSRNTEPKMLPGLTVRKTCVQNRGEENGWRKTEYLASQIACTASFFSTLDVRSGTLRSSFINFNQIASSHVFFTADGRCFSLVFLFYFFFLFRGPIGWREFWLRTLPYSILISVPIWNMLPRNDIVNIWCFFGYKIDGKRYNSKQIPKS